MSVLRLWCLSVPLLLAVATAGLHAAETIGAGVSMTTPTPIAQVIARPADFEGTTIRVDGVVTEVCKAMGCWMALAPADAPQGATVLLQVDHDGKIVFPLSARGKKAAAQGVLQRVRDAEGREASAELAREQGRPAPEPEASWQIKATGAIIY
jgi:hypothetical protein